MKCTEERREEERIGEEDKRRGDELRTEVRRGEEIKTIGKEIRGEERRGGSRELPGSGRGEFIMRVALESLCNSIQLVCQSNLNPTSCVISSSVSTLQIFQTICFH